MRGDQRKNLANNFTIIFSTMNKKIYILIIGFVLLIILSQWIVVRMVYAKSIKGDLAINIATFYNLKAATIEKNGESLEVSLSDFLKSERLAKKLLAIKTGDNEDAANVFSPKNEEELDNVVWDNVIKKIWLEKLAGKHDLLSTAEDVDAGIKELEKNNFLKQSDIQNFGISEEEYTDMIIKPFVLETKVYAWLLDNYNDFDGMNRTQSAYQSLEEGRDFDEVAQDFSDEYDSRDALFWFKDSDLVEYLEPIKYLEPKGFSKIIIMPGPYGVYYTIWYLDSKIVEEDETSYGVRGMYVKAKTLDQFYDDYLLGASINKLY